MICQFYSHHLDYFIVVRRQREGDVAHRATEVDFDARMEKSILNNHHVEAKGTGVSTEVEIGDNLLLYLVQPSNWDIATYYFSLSTLRC